MTIVFDNPLESPLSPHHYIEFKANHAGAGIQAQGQSLLIIDIVKELPDAAKLPKNSVMTLGFIKEKKYSLSAELQKAVDSAQKTYPEVNLSVVITDNIKEGIAALPEVQYTQLAITNDEKEVIKELCEELDRRWGHDLQNDGHLFVASKKSASEITAIAAELNSIHLTIVPVTDAEQNLASWAAAFAALNAKYALQPSRPYQTLAVKGLKSESEGFKFKERNELLKAGVSTWKKLGASITIDRLVTTYTKSPSGSVDASYRDLNTKQTLTLLRFDFRNFIALNFPRHMLAKDDYEYDGPVITPKMAKLFAISRYRLWQRNNLVQDPGGLFAKNVRVEVDENVPGKLDFYLPVHVMGQWQITQTSIAFRI